MQTPKLTMKYNMLEWKRKSITISHTVLYIDRILGLVLTKVKYVYEIYEKTCSYF